jgi:hypothetical protein
LDCFCSLTGNKERCSVKGCDSYIYYVDRCLAGFQVVFFGVVFKFASRSCLGR